MTDGAQETNSKKFPLWFPWAGAAMVVAGIILLMTMHVGFRSLVLVGAIGAVITAIIRWNTTPQDKRVTLLVIPAAVSIALLAIFMYLRFSYLPAALEQDSYQQEFTQYDDGSGGVDFG